MKEIDKNNDDDDEADDDATESDNNVGVEGNLSQKLDEILDAIPEEVIAKGITS
jgi:hypothetical protein